MISLFLSQLLQFYCVVVVVIAIIAILASILMPALQSARQRGQSAACLNNLKSLGMACQNYSEDYNGWLPRTSFNFPGSGGSAVLDIMGRKSIGADSLHGWHVYMSTASTGHSNISKNLPRLKYIPSDTSFAKGVLVCPGDADPRFGLKGARAKFMLSYAINSGITGGSYNPGDQTNWLHRNDFARLPDKEPARGPSRRSPSLYPLIADSGSVRDEDTYKTHFLKGSHSIGQVPNGAEDFKDPLYWSDSYSPSGLGARHNSSVNTVFVDGHAKSIKTPIFNTHSATSQRILRWLCPGYADGAHWN
ncbi:MAG: DUF1559 domain-containing protein [Lentisphaeria bacterium]|nr:DUF1559 domain-containing protein [Lentisphaeria bacterium]